MGWRAVTYMGWRAVTYMGWISFFVVVVVS